MNEDFDDSSENRQFPAGINALLPLIYAELRKAAARQLRRERHNYSLRPTELANEVYLRLSRDPSFAYQGRTHFLAIAGKVTRRILVEHARKKMALKRGGKALVRVTLDDNLMAVAGTTVDVLALNQALEKLAAQDASAAQVVELRYFSGLTEIETAEAMDMSERWVRKRWSFARAWLHRELNPTS